jgi:hypothetical protein
MCAPYDKGQYRPLDTFAFEQVTVDDTADALTAATYDPASGNGPAIVAMIQVETAQVRYRIDGTNPTATVGTLLDAGDELVVWGTMDIQSIRFIRTGGVSATLNVHYAR